MNKLLTITVEAEQALEQLPSWIKRGRFLQGHGLAPSDMNILIRTCQGDEDNTSKSVVDLSRQVILLCEGYMPYIKDLTEIDFSAL